MKFHRTLLCYGLPLVCALFPACKDKDAVKVYRVSKAEPEVSAAPQASSVSSVQAPAPESAGMGGMQPMVAPVQSGLPAVPPSQITGTPPTNWESQPLTSMRQASYLVKGTNGSSADISLVTLAGSAGGVLDNANRWLSQLGQPALTAEQLAQRAQHVASSLGDVTLVDLEGLPQGADAAKDGRIVAGIASGNNKTYFFKMRGNAVLAESQKEGFIQWIGSVQPPKSAPETATPVAASTPETAAPAASGKKQQLLWEVPQGWKPVPPSSMRYASFSVAGKDGESTDISVSVFAGDGGGDLANVNRWRAQIGLKEIGTDDLKSLILPVSCKDAQILTVEMPGAKTSILAGWAKIDGQSWFFKMTAPARQAEGEKAAFVKFLQSIQFHS